MQNAPQFNFHYTRKNLSCEAGTIHSQATSVDDIPLTVKEEIEVLSRKGSKPCLEVWKCPKSATIAWKRLAIQTTVKLIRNTKYGKCRVCRPSGEPINQRDFTEKFKMVLLVGLEAEIKQNEGTSPKLSKVHSIIFTLICK